MFLLKIKKILIIILCVEFFFILPFLLSLPFLFLSIQSLKSFKPAQSTMYNSYAKPFVNLAATAFTIPQKTLFFVPYMTHMKKYLAIYQHAFSILEEGSQAVEIAQSVFKNIITESSPKNNLMIASLTNQTNAMYSNLVSMNKLLETINIGKTFKDKLHNFLSYIKTLNEILPFVPSLLGQDKPSHNLILFLNNRELRPGGGFIGSYGTVSFDNYRLLPPVVHDVYDADGQLKEQIIPPDPVKKYLGLSNWFLRDSNFDPQFSQNVNRAVWFLDKEFQNNPTYNGGIGITTSAITYLLVPFGNIYLPDYRETVNADNFYIKTQSYVEGKFFPGSTQKRSFLSSLMRACMQKLPSIPPNLLLGAFVKALNEKQIVLYADNKIVQESINTYHWGGTISPLLCPSSICIDDFFFPIDANVGANKANYYVSRLIKSSTVLASSGSVEKSIAIQYKNESSPDVFPAGVYKNYFQAYIPKNTVITSVSLNSIQIPYSQEPLNDRLQKISLFFEVLPKQSVTLSFIYTIPFIGQSNQEIYYISTFQKQTGLIQTDLKTKNTFPQSFSIHAINYLGETTGKTVTVNSPFLNDYILSGYIR